MDVILAVNQFDLEEFIEGIDGIRVTRKLQNSITVAESCEELNPDLVIVSNLLAGSASAKLASELTNSKFFTGRVMFLIDTLNSSGLELVASLESLGIFDYLVGEIDPDELQEMIHRPRLKKAEQEYLKKAKELSGLADKNSVKIVEKKVYYSDKNSIAVIGNSSTGKSTITWLLAKMLAANGNDVCILGLDNNSSHSIYFNIPNESTIRVDNMITRKLFSALYTGAFRTPDNITVVGLPMNSKGVAGKVSTEDLQSLIGNLKLNSDILIVDCPSGDADMTRSIIANTSMDLLVFDLDGLHFFQNYRMVEYMSSFFKPEKTVALLNRCDKKARSFKEVLKGIRQISSDFMDVCFVGDYGAKIQDMILEEAQVEGFGTELSEEIDKLTVALKCKKKDQRKGLFGKIFGK